MKQSEESREAQKQLIDLVILGNQLESCRIKNNPVVEKKINVYKTITYPTRISIIQIGTKKIIPVTILILTKESLIIY